MKRKNTLWIVPALLGGLVVFWLLGLKLLMKLMKGRGEPCPTSWSWLVDNPLRRWDVRHALDRAGLRAGETMLELGPGPGAFTVDAAQRVGPEGRLIAVDIQPGMIAQVDARVKAAGVTNVETYVASAYELPLPDASVDVTLCDGGGHRHRCRRAIQPRQHRRPRIRHPRRARHRRGHSPHPQRADDHRGWVGGRSHSSLNRSRSFRPGPYHTRSRILAHCPRPGGR